MYNSETALGQVALHLLCITTTFLTLANNRLF